MRFDTSRAIRRDFVARQPHIAGPSLGTAHQQHDLAGSDRSGRARTAAPLAALLAEQYRIERRLGAGGMATVWLAEDLRRRRKVAITGDTRLDRRRRAALEAKVSTRCRPTSDRCWPHAPWRQTIDGRTRTGVS
jgi:hypothetical protein